MVPTKNDMILWGLLDNLSQLLRRFQFDYSRLARVSPLERLKCVYRDWCCRRAWHPYHLTSNFERVYFYHIRKTGGTSINYMFLSLGCEDPQAVYELVSNRPYFGTVSGDKVFAGWKRSLIERGRYFYAFSHKPQHELSLPANTFTLTCLRDPVQRVVSLYMMLHNYQINDIPHPGMKRQGKWLGDSFGDFLDRLPKEELLNQIYMFSSTFNVEESVENIINCSHVMFTEYFDLGIDSLAAKLNLPLTPIHVRSSPVTPPITRIERERLREMLEPEYELYEKTRRALCTDI